MSTLVITKQTGNFFSLVVDSGNPIISEQNRLTTVGDYCNFKTANGANLILKQNILYSEITLIASGTFTFLSINALWVKLIEVGFFDGIAGTGGGSAIDRFDELTDTFTYLGRGGQIVVVNDSETGLNTITYSIFTLEDEEKLDGIETGAQVNVNADWNEDDPLSKKFIENKPTISGFVMVDFPRLVAPQQDFELLVNQIAKWAEVNGTTYYLETANNTAEFNTFTQLSNIVTFKDPLEIGNYPVIFIQ
jgi:hypothetical protein